PHEKSSRNYSLPPPLDTAWDFSMDTEFTDTFLMIMPLLALLILSILLIVFLRSRDVTTWCRPQAETPTPVDP
ncbi:MAG: hypothetical protein Q4B02_12010, partial [Propionibacteriaceae bacterium]|nr:hypothetical protein [Propionibacteriaceae bacterium]